MKLAIYNASELNFVELNVTGNNDTYMRCAPESKYIDSIVFNIFVPCFENANKLFDFFGPTKYNSRRIIPLRNELIKNLTGLEQVKSLEKFITIFARKFLGKDFLEELVKQDSEWRTKWPEYMEKLTLINRQLITLAEQCAGEERILWVIGY